LGLRAATNSSGFSPFQSVTGATLLTPQLFVDKQTNVTSDHHSIQDYINEMETFDFTAHGDGDCHGTKPVYVPRDLLTCDSVWLRVDRVRRPLEAPYTGPYTVIKRFDKVFRVLSPSGKEETVSIDRLKVAHTVNDSPRVTLNHQPKSRKSKKNKRATQLNSTTKPSDATGPTGTQPTADSTTTPQPQEADFEIIDECGTQAPQFIVPNGDEDDVHDQIKLPENYVTRAGRKTTPTKRLQYS
jgi:hypothetical protein